MSLVQRDYILRIFEQMGQVVAVVIGLKKSGQPAEALAVMNESLQGLVGFDLDDVERINAGDLVQMVRLSRSGSTSASEMVAGQLAVIAGLLVQAAEIHDLQGEPARADVARLKALHLNLVVLTEESATLEPAREAVGPLLQQVSDYVLPYSLIEMLWRYHEQESGYAEAENCLFDLLEGAEVVDDTVDKGIAFYTRLLKKSDEDLIAGGLPRNEVEAGLRELKNM